MPFYEYQCKNCGHTLEAMQKVNDAPLRKCPDCGKSQLTRLMSAPVFRLKGGGWYETDFKGDQDHKKNLADRPEADAAKDETKSSDTAAADSSGKDAAKPAEKGADKPAEKAAPKETKQSEGGGGMSKRGAAAAVKPKAAAKKPAVRNAAKSSSKAAKKAKSRR